MGRKRSPETDEKIDDWIKEGRGQGEGPSYQPWLDVSVPSRGKAWRLYSSVAGRELHLLSGLEQGAARIINFDPATVDINEQKPLLPRAKTIEIANGLGYRHPVNPQTRIPIVMTSDLYVTYRDKDGRLWHRVICVKPASELNDPTVLKKLETERRYWNLLGIEWRIVTDRDIPESLVENIKSFEKFTDPASFGIEDDDVLNIKVSLEIKLQNNPSLPLRKITNSCDEELGYQGGTSLSVVKHLLATRIWRTNLYERIRPGYPLKLI